MGENLPGEVKDTDLHVVPVDDWRPHEYSSQCWCKPTEELDTEHNEFLWIHRSMDQRELYEQGLRKVN